MKKSLEIFKPGMHTAMGGEEISFSESDLLATALAYDPKLHEAPLVVGHPKTDDPAYGWVKSLSLTEGILNAEPAQVEPQFAELVNAGSFKKISASFYTPDSPNNPKKGVFYLRHVGFLGAQAPSLKGLKSASFKEDEAGVVTIEFNETEKPTDLIPEPKVKEFSEISKEGNMPLLPEEIAKQKADLDTRSAEIAKKEISFAEQQKELDKQKAELATEAAKRKRISLIDFVEALSKEGKILPTLKDGLVSFMCIMNDQTVVEFGEGEKKVSENALSWMKTFLKSLPKQVQFGEFAPDSEHVSPESDPAVIAQKAVAYQEAQSRDGNIISVSRAVAHITKGGK